MLVMDIRSLTITIACRSRTSDMSAWNYTRKVLEDRDLEILEDPDALVGVCR